MNLSTLQRLRFSAAFLPVLTAGLYLVLVDRVTAQTFTTLHNFTALFSRTNSDGATPYAGLILSSNTLYGTASFGGSSRNGTVFKVRTEGTGFLNLHSFTGGSDGSGPRAGLILSGNTLYGTAGWGGSSGWGTVYAINTDGTGFTNLHSFTGGSDGAYPFADLILSENTLYGTAYEGGNSGAGTVFAVNTDGTGFTNLYSFTDRVFPSYTNNDGAYPFAGLILSGNTLYGTAQAGGSAGLGTVFKLNTDGAGFTNLHSFSAFGSGSTNSDGAGPDAGLILSGNTLYGAAGSGGNSGNGAVFAVNTDGTGFMNLHSFAAGHSVGPPSSFNYTNSDGVHPGARLLLSGNTLYGTASGGGISGNGTVFSLSFAPQLTIIPSGANVVLTWPTNYAGFDYTGFSLQSAQAISGPFTNIPNATNPYTNPITGAQQFFRLISN